MKVVTEEDFAGEKPGYADIKNYCDECDFYLCIVEKTAPINQLNRINSEKIPPNGN